MRERHATPFEMVDFRFSVKAPITVCREWMRHRTGSFNEMSGRYTEYEPCFYTPAPKDIRHQTGKPGSYKFIPFEQSQANLISVIMEKNQEDAYKAYKGLLELGVAKELSRTVLPMGMYSQFTWKVNLRNLLNFITLRSDETAMFEIREYSKQLEKFVEQVVPITWEAYVKHGRQQL